jgi:hypothetical protein
MQLFMSVGDFPWIPEEILSIIPVSFSLNINPRRDAANEL